PVEAIHCELHAGLRGLEGAIAVHRGHGEPGVDHRGVEEGEAEDRQDEEQHHRRNQGAAALAITREMLRDHPVASCRHRFQFLTANRVAKVMGPTSAPPAASNTARLKLTIRVVPPWRVKLRPLPGWDGRSVRRIGSLMGTPASRLASLSVMHVGAMAGSKRHRMSWSVSGSRYRHTYPP